MKKTTILLAVVTSFASVPRLAAAQEEISATAADAAPPPAEEVESRPEEAETIKAIVRGPYVEARGGGGFMLAGATLPGDVVTAYGLKNDSEKLGGGAQILLAAGYDLTDMIALQAIGGLTLVSGGGRLNRDLSVVFGGAGVRLGVNITDRLHFLAEAGVGFASAADGVTVDDTNLDDSEINDDHELGRSDSGVAALGGAGIEYYVHVRHFSVGINVSILAPFSPFRMFVSLTPTVKYTF